MIQEVKIKDFRSLADVTLKLGPFNVLIGENGAGKSSFLDAVRLVSDLVSMQWTQAFNSRRRAGFPEIIRRNSKDDSVSVQIDFSAGNKSYRHGITLTKNGDSPAPLSKDEFLIDTGAGIELMHLSLGRGNVLDSSSGVSSLAQFNPEMSGLAGLADVSKYPWAEECRKFYKSVRRYRFDPDSIRKPSRIDPGAQIEEDGTGLAAVFDNLEQETQAAINSSAATAIPELMRFEARPAYDGNKVIVLKENWDKNPFYPSQISDGALRHLALVMLGFSAGSQVVLLEEPENGLNPHRFAALVDLWRSAAEFGGPQFIVATHSTIFLDFIREGEIFLVGKSKGISDILKLGDIKAFRDRVNAFEGSIGDAWFAGVLGTGGQG